MLLAQPKNVVAVALILFASFPSIVHAASVAQPRNAPLQPRVSAGMSYQCNSPNTVYRCPDTYIQSGTTDSNGIAACDKSSEDRRCYYSFRDGSPAPSTMTGQANEPQCPSMAASTTTCYSGSGSYTCQNPVRMDNGEVTCDNMMRRRGINTDPDWVKKRQALSSSVQKVSGEGKKRKRKTAAKGTAGRK